jgi:hypothetical protein
MCWALLVGLTATHAGEVRGHAAEVWLMVTRAVEIRRTRGGGEAAGNLSAGSFELGSSSVEMYGGERGVRGRWRRKPLWEFFFFFILRHPPGAGWVWLDEEREKQPKCYRGR